MVARRWVVNRATRAVSLGSAVVVVGGFAAFRRWHLQRGATEDEVDGTMPGDELVEAPTFAPTRAMTIRARPAQVWPWLAQIGYGRAGLYSYDLLDNLGHGRSADRIHPQLQHLNEGDWIPMAPMVTEETAFRVHAIDPGTIDGVAQAHELLGMAIERTARWEHPPGHPREDALPGAPPEHPRGPHPDGVRRLLDDATRAARRATPRRGVCGKRRDGR
jgi:hypothetical protein